MAEAEAACVQLKQNNQFCRASPTQLVSRFQSSHDLAAALLRTLES